MATQSLETFLLALKQGREFIPIQVSSLRLDTVTNFDLYIQATPGEPAVLYADHTLPFNEKSRSRLEDNQIQFLYIHVDQINEYRKYIENNLSAILADVGIRLDEKSRLLHITAQGVVQQVLEGDDLAEGLERGGQLVAHTVDFLFGQRNALRHLVESASANYEIYSHSVNVCIMGLALAQRMGFPADRLVEFGMGALFRDVGMSKISPEIVNNTGSLTIEQYDEIKTHPVLGVQMLQDCGVTSEGTLDVVRHHHEKLDGSGYPDGLANNELSPFVRICTVVDIFDALTTNRIHKKAIGTYEALQVMSQEMQGELDLDTMKAMITMLGFSK
jgi:HD-GYP domain-containing protein (c-di-GMP phosphodiesterase class II)